MQSLSSDASARAPRSTLTLWLILAVCAAPVIGSYIAYYFWQPAGHANYGELIEPRPVPDDELVLFDGRPMRLSQLRGDWVMLVADAAACEEVCRRQLTYIRQVRLAAGKEKERIERVWLVKIGRA